MILWLLLDCGALVTLNPSGKSIRLQKEFAENDRLNPEKLSTDIARFGGDGCYLPDIEALA